MKSHAAGKNKLKKYRKPDFEDDDHFEIQTKAEDIVITDKDLVGSIYSIKDGFWKFQHSGRENHPGACLDVKSTQAYLVHGTDSNSATAHGSKVSYIVEPDAQNGLTKKTAFILELYSISRRKLLFYHIDRKIGCLDGKALFEMKRIARIYTSPWDVIL